MKARKSKIHRVVVRLQFDRPCTRRYAVYEAKQAIYGTEYTAGLHEDGLPEQFNVKVLSESPDNKAPK